MAFAFKSASCIAVGTFNIYVLVPQWLTKVGLLEEGEVEFRFNLQRPGFKFTPPNGPDWTVKPDQIIIESKYPEMDCGAKVGSVLEHLPHTPLFAIGNNFHFTAAPDDIGSLPPPIGIPAQKLPPNTRLKGRSWQVGIDRHDVVFNIQLSEAGEKLDLSVNVHQGLSEAKTPGALIQTAKRFAETRKESLEIIQQVFETRIQWHQ